MLLRTALFETHVAAGGKMVPFGGWEMPLHYGSILPEHHVVRRSAGMFDVGHMGRLLLTGPDAERFLNGLLTRDVRKLADGRSGYTLICNEGAGVIDDAIATRFGAGFFVVVNASNRTAVLEWFESRRPGHDIRIDDITQRSGMIAVQGPKSADIARAVLGHDLAGQKYYSGAKLPLLSGDGVEGVLFRSGYTGEDGFEAVVPASRSAEWWGKFAAAGATPAGLGARDTLRLEAGMPLYGHEYTLRTDGLSAGMDWVIHLDKEFVGVGALRKIKAAGPARKLVGLEIAGRRQARQGYPVLSAGSTVGEVTSGALSPTLEKVIAMAYVDAAHSAAGTTLDVSLGRETASAKVVALPFYKRAK